MAPLLDTPVKPIFYLYNDGNCRYRGITIYMVGVVMNRTALYDIISRGVSNVGPILLTYMRGEEY